jgi:hypothetical protein
MAGDSPQYSGLDAKLFRGSPRFPLGKRSSALHLRGMTPRDFGDTTLRMVLRLRIALLDNTSKDAGGNHGQVRCHKEQ